MLVSGSSLILFFQTNMHALEPGLLVSNKISSSQTDIVLQTFQITGPKLTFRKVLNDKITKKLLLFLSLLQISLSKQISSSKNSLWCPE